MFLCGAVCASLHFKQEVLIVKDVTEKLGKVFTEFCMDELNFKVLFESLWIVNNAKQSVDENIVVEQDVQVDELNFHVLFGSLRRSLEKSEDENIFVEQDAQVAYESFMKDLNDSIVQRLEKLRA